MIKTKTRTFPPGTFIPTPLRVVAIIHLCIAFSVLLFNMGYPFMGKLFEQKRLNGIYESVINHSNQFKSLPYQEQMKIRAGHHELLNSMHQSFSTKLKDSIRIILLELPPFQKAWIFFSIIIPILMLMKIDGAHRAAWILPFISFVYISNQFFMAPPQDSQTEYALFPTEQTLLNKYLKEPLSPNISDQREQLLKGWHLYLIDVWALESPAQTLEEREQQISRGNFFFNIARINAIEQDTKFPSYLRNKGLFFLMAFFAWNLYFAWFANRRKWFR